MVSLDSLSLENIKILNVIGPIMPYGTCILLIKEEQRVIVALINGEMLLIENLQSWIA